MVTWWRKGVAPLFLFLMAGAISAVPEAAQTSSADPFDASAEQIVDVRVEGNRRLSDAAFFRLTTLRSGQAFDPITVRRQFAVLWDSGLFDDIWVEALEARGGKVVVFHVSERPVVLQVVYQKSPVVSQTAIEDHLRERKLSIDVNQPVDRTRIRAVEEEIRRLHDQKGHLGTEVRAEIEILPNNGQSVEFKIKPGAKTLIKKIDFTGNTLYSDRQLKKLMQNTIETGFKGTFSKKDLYHPLKFTQDLESVRTAYHSRGRLDLNLKAPIVEFLQKKKDEPAEPAPPPPPPPNETEKQKNKRLKREAKQEEKALKKLPPKKKAIIVVPLEEGPEYTVGAVTVDGNTIFSDAVLRPFIRLTPGEIFNADALTQSLDGIESLYGQRGYFFASTNRAITRQEGNVADVAVHITEGKQYSLNRVEFGGNPSTRDRVLRREMPLEEGKVFDTRLWQIGLTRINQLGYWAMAKEPEITPVEGEPLLNARVEGNEQGRNEIQVGGGFSGSEGGFFQGSYGTRNFLGRGEIVQAAIQVGGRSKMVNLSFTEPYFMGTNNTVGASIFRRELDFDDFTRKSTGYSILFGQRLGNFTSYALTYRNVRFDESSGSIFFVPVSFLPDDFDLQGLISGEFGTPIATESTITNSSLLPTFTHNTVNNPFRPTKGLRFRFTLEITGGPLGGDNDFLKPILRTTWYRPLWRKTHLAINMEAGKIEAFNDSLIPRSERFFMGGDTRGPRVFETRSLAPLGPICCTEPLLDNDGNVIGVPFAEVGGDAFFLVQTELVYQVGSSFDLAAFFDAGNAFDELTGYDLGELRYSAGIEGRFYLPIFQAPIRLIYGKVLDEEDGDQVNSFQFSIGFPF